MSEYFRTLDLLFQSNYQVISADALKRIMQSRIKRSMLELDTYDGHMDTVDHVIEMWRNKTLFHTTVDQEKKKMLVCL
jgi:hypothetical protein